MKRAPRGSLVWRLYALGVVQLVLLAAAVVIVGVILSAPPPGRHEKARALAIEGAAARLAPLVDSPEALAAALDGLRSRYDLEASLYDEGRRLVATNVEPALSLDGGGPPGPPRRGAPPGPPPPGPPPPRPGELFGRLPGPLAGPPPGPPPGRVASSPFTAGGRAWVLVAREGPPPTRQSPPPSPLVTFFLSGFVVVGLGALLTRRWITRPLERLSGAARSLGSGDLDARAGLARNDEFGDVSRAFDEMAERVRGLLLAEKELLANVSHELRTPLARIRVALDLASEGDAEAARSSLAEIAVDLNELESLVDDILTARRLELADAKAGAGGFAMRRERLAAADLAERAASRFRARHPGRPFEVTVERALPEIEADPMLLRRAVDNLLENAHKYSPEQHTPITLKAYARGGSAMFEVEDRGIGIAQGDLPHVFTAFFRGDRSRSRAEGGVGLGLTLAKRIVEAHGGDVELTSAPGGGTTARVRVPFAPSRPGRVGPEREPHYPGSRSGSTQPS